MHIANIFINDVWNVGTRFEGSDWVWAYLTPSMFVLDNDTIRFASAIIAIMAGLKNVKDFKG